MSKQNQYRSWINLNSLKKIPKEPSIGIHGDEYSDQDVERASKIVADIDLEKMLTEEKSHMARSTMELILTEISKHPQTPEDALYEFDVQYSKEISSALMNTISIHDSRMRYDGNIDFFKGARWAGWFGGGLISAFFCAGLTEDYDSAVVGIILGGIVSISGTICHLSKRRYEKKIADLEEYLIQKFPTQQSIDSGDILVLRSDASKYILGCFTDFSERVGNVTLRMLNYYNSVREQTLGYSILAERNWSLDREHIICRLVPASNENLNSSAIRQLAMPNAMLLLKPDEEQMAYGILGKRSSDEFTIYSDTKRREKVLTCSYSDIDNERIKSYLLMPDSMKINQASQI